MSHLFLPGRYGHRGTGKPRGTLRNLQEQDYVTRSQDGSQLISLPVTGSRSLTIENFPDYFSSSAVENYA